MIYLVFLWGVFLIIANAPLRAFARGGGWAVLLHPVILLVLGSLLPFIAFTKLLLLLGGGDEGMYEEEMQRAGAELRCGDRS